MRRRCDRFRVLCSLAITAAATLGGALLFMSPAWAHTSLVASSPEPETEVGGHVDRVELEFGGDVSGPGILLVDPDGRHLGGTVSQPFTNRATIVLPEPLSVPGSYSVDYAIVSVDGDRVDDTFTFDFVPDAQPPVPLPMPGSGPSQLLLVTIGVGLGAACVATFTYLQGRKARREL